MIIVKPIATKHSDSMFETSVNESQFYSALKKAQSKLHKPQQKKYMVVKSYTEEYIIADNGLPKCVSKECTGQHENGKYLVFVEKETRLHNSQFNCHDNYQSVLHVDSLSFKVGTDCHVIFEMSVNEQDKACYSVYATGNEKSGINILENILE